MASSLKCPNPSCPFLFDPSQVPPGAVLTCPRCTMRFTLGPAAAGAAPPSSGLDFSSTKRPEPSGQAVPEPEAKPSLLQSRGLLIAGIAACAVISAVAIWLAVGGKKPPITAPGETLYRDINLAAHVPDGWEHDENARKIANVLSQKKVDSSARIAIATSAYRTRNPQPGELKAGLFAERLPGLFEDIDATESESTWLGQQARKFTFRARGPRGEGNFAGEAYAVAAHGFAYWFIGWAQESEWEKVAAEIEAIRKGCRLIDPNPEWKPSESGSKTLDGEGFRLIDGDGWWTQGDPTLEDNKARMLLTAKFQSRLRVDRPPQATAVVYLLPAGSDPLASLRSYAKERYAKLYDIKTWNDLTGEPQGDPPAAGMPARADVARYHAENAQSPGVSKLVVLNAISTPQGIIGMEVYCPWSDREKWEKRMIALAASLSAR